MPQDDPFLQANIKATYDTYARYEYYFVGLIFTLLVLAVQTADFTGGPWQDRTELVGWLLTLIAGGVGLVRLSNFSAVYGLGAKRESARLQIQDLHNMRHRGEEVVIGVDPIGEGVEYEHQHVSVAIQKLEIKYKVLGDLLDKRQGRNVWQRRAQVSAFFGGLVALMVARAWVPLKEITAVLGW
jgi:hypothetical protein